MKAGPELDAAVAAVLGWNLPPPISTDWGAAGFLVELLVANSYTFRVRFEVNQQWYCEFALGSKSWHVYSETAPHAISLAALAAVKSQ